MKKLKNSVVVYVVRGEREENETTILSICRKEKYAIDLVNDFDIASCTFRTKFNHAIFDSVWIETHHIGDERRKNNADI